MNCNDIGRKIYTNEILLNEEKEHLNVCSNCKEMYDFNNYLSVSIKKNLKYPYFKPVIPSFIYTHTNKSFYSLLKPAIGYAFILAIGLSVGYFVGNIIYHIPLKEGFSISKSSSKTMRVNPMTPIATNETMHMEESFAIPVDDVMKKELNLYGGVILLGADAIKKLFAKCNSSFEVDLKQNDIVIEINGNIVNDQKSLENNIINNCNSIIFKIMRGGKVIEKKYDFKFKKITK